MDVTLNEGGDPLTLPSLFLMGQGPLNLSFWPTRGVAASYGEKIITGL